MKQSPDNEPPVAENENPSLPWFRTWRGVYLFVIGCFVFYVVLLTVLTLAFS